MVKEDEYEFVQQLVAEQLTPEYITIDIAHGHSNAAINMIQHIKTFTRELRYRWKRWNSEAVRELENAGADATKVGIGPGKVCITKIKTGFGTGWRLVHFAGVQKRKQANIADGGIRTHGDVAKSIRFGATMVMTVLYSLVTKSLQETIERDGKLYKEYFGSASEFKG